MSRWLSDEALLTSRVTEICWAEKARIKDVPTQPEAPLIRMRCALFVICQ